MKLPINKPIGLKTIANYPKFATFGRINYLQWNEIPPKILPES